MTKLLGDETNIVGDDTVENFMRVIEASYLSLTAVQSKKMSELRVYVSL